MSDDDYLLGTMTTTIAEATIHPDATAQLESDLDPLTMHSIGAGRWGLPSDPPTELDPGAVLPPSQYDYSYGILNGIPPNEADALPAGYRVAGLLREAGIPQAIYQTPHEATHRRFEPVQRTTIAQAAAGFTLIAPPNQGLHYVKLLGCFLTLDAAGTLKWTQSDSAGTGVSATTSPGDLSGLMNLGGAAVPALALPMAEIANPWLYTSPDLAFGLFTVTGKAQGWVTWCYSPYDS